jgi:hypothetical protein
MTDTTTNTTTTPGVKGMTRSTWRDDTHLRGLLLKLISQNPNATHDELEELYLSRAMKKPALVAEALRLVLSTTIWPPSRSRRRVLSDGGNSRRLLPRISPPQTSI